MGKGEMGKGKGKGDREKRKGERGNGDSLLVSVFRLFTHQTGHLVSSFNMENDQRITAHLLRLFPAISEKVKIFGFSVLDSWPSILQSK